MYKLCPDSGMRRRLMQRKIQRKRKPRTLTVVPSECGITAKLYFLYIFSLIFHSSITCSMHISILQASRSPDKVKNFKCNLFSKAYLMKTSLFNNTNASRWKWYSRQHSLRKAPLEPFTPITLTHLQFHQVVSLSALE